MWNLVSFVRRAKIRLLVLEQLSRGPVTPTELAKATKNHRPSISRAISDLKERGLLECLTPNEKLGRLYKATEKGEKVLKRVKQLG